MQWLNRIKIAAVIAGLLPWAAMATDGEKFRTPAKLYAGAYSVKIQAKKGFTEYDIPMWVKPDQAESTMDPGLIYELGYVDREISFDDVRIAGYGLEKKSFKPQKTEWAFVPDFAKACCFGVIGRDILANYEIRFNPKNPSAIEWTPITNSENQNKAPLKPDFVAGLKKLFSLNEGLKVPVTLNIQERTMKLEGTPEKAPPSLFGFYFVPPDRVVQVTTIHAKDSIAAKKAGFTTGVVITEINGEKAAGLDRWVIEEYLRGQRGDTLRLRTKNQKEFTFDFKTRDFKKN